MQTFNIKIGGEAGQGLVSIGNILLRAITQEGWHLFAHQDYESRIRGGHNFFQIRLANKPVASWENEIDVLVALDETTIILGQGELRSSGVVIYDPGVLGEKAKELGNQPNYLGLPFGQIAEELGQPKIVANAAAAGAIWALLSDDLITLHQTLDVMFGSKGKKVVEGNQKVATAGFDKVREVMGSRSKPAKPERQGERLLLKGNDALPLEIHECLSHDASYGSHGVHCRVRA